MAKTLLKVKCEKCRLRLVEFLSGKRTGEVLIATGPMGFRLDPRKFKSEGIGIAICPRCGAATEFDGKYLPAPEASPKLH